MEFYNRIDVNDITKCIRKDEAFIQYHISENRKAKEEVESDSNTVLFAELTDLVQRRNLIAHGAGDDDLLDIKTIIRYAKYIKALNIAIFNVLEKNAQKIVFEKNECINLGKPIAVFDNCIVCINSKGASLKIGTMVYAKSESTFTYGKIVDLEIDRKKVKSIKAGYHQDFGMKVDFCAKDNYSYYIVDEKVDKK